MERIRLDFDFHLTLVSLSGNQVFTDIQEQLTNLSHLENEVYFNPDYKKDISDIESESKIAFENKQLSS